MLHGYGGEKEIDKRRMQGARVRRTCRWWTSCWYSACTIPWWLQEVLD